MANSAVIGALYGDEGKGRTVDYLVSKAKNPLVVRFNGGPQAGHTVIDKSGERHVFSHFGAGSLRGAPTYWAENCLFNPVTFLKEKISLKEKFNVESIFYLDGNCKVITLYDIAANRIMSTINNLGTCGMGINECIRRSENISLNLRVADFQDNADATRILDRIRFDFINKFYNSNNELKYQEFLPDDLKEFVKSAVSYSSHFGFISYMNSVLDNEVVNMPQDHLQSYDLIFEGAQGLMLDEYFGNFPHVTPSRTGSHNITALCRKWGVTVDATYYITRCYMTRHGTDINFVHKDISNYVDVQDPTNKPNDWQGTLKTDVLDLRLLRYTIDADKPYVQNKNNRYMVLTCTDQLKDVDRVYWRDYYGLDMSIKDIKGSLSQLVEVLPLKTFITFDSPSNY